MIKTTRTDLVCLECGDVFSIQRIVGRTKKVGHIKDIYCPCCMEETPHFEVRDAYVFMKECENKGLYRLDEETHKVYTFIAERYNDNVRIRR